MPFPLDDRYRALVSGHIAPVLKQEGNTGLRLLDRRWLALADSGRK
jgi:hypothetical protein